MTGGRWSFIVNQSQVLCPPPSKVIHHGKNIGHPNFIPGPIGSRENLQGSLPLLVYKPWVSCDFSHRDDFSMHFTMDTFFLAQPSVKTYNYGF